MMKSKLILLLLSSVGQKKPKRETSDRGFTLIEVIVAIVILSIFILASLTALVAGLNSKLRAKLGNEATLIIQQDLETVRYKASYYGGIKTITDVSPILPATGLNTVSANKLDLTIPITNNGTSLSYTANEALTIGGQSAVYTATSDQTNPTTSLAVTVDLSKLNTIKQASLASSLILSSGTAISSVTVTDASNIQVGDRIVIGPETTSSTDIFITTVTGVVGNVVSFASFSPITAKTVGKSVSILPRVGDIISKTSSLTAFKDCTYSSSSTTSSIATKFITDEIPDPSPSTTVPFNDRTYNLTRTATSLSDTRVQLVYSVIEPTFSTTQSLATLTTEVIPSVTFQCTR